MVKKVDIILDVEDMISNELIAQKIRRAIEAEFFLAKIVVIEVNNGSTDSNS